MQLMLDLKKSFFSTWTFFQEHSRITGLAGKGEGYNSLKALTLFHYLHLLHRYLDIYRVFTSKNNSDKKSFALKYIKL